jgi:transposase
MHHRIMLRAERESTNEIARFGVLKPQILAVSNALASEKKTPAQSLRGLFTDDYSPDLNPIEQFFAKLKHWLRKAAKRTTEAVYDAIAPILHTVTSAECANYFTNAGYDQI